MKKPQNWQMDCLNNYCDEIGLSKSYNTIIAYRYDVAKFLEFLEDRKIKRASSIKSEHVVDYLNLQKEQGKSGATMFRYHMSIKGFLAWMEDTGKIGNNPVARMKAPFVKKKIREVPSQEQIYDLLNVPDIKTYCGLRDKAIMEVLYSSGLRASELCDLEIANYNGRSLIVECGKGNKTRIVPLNKHAIECIEAYLEERGREEGYLFVTELGNRLSRGNLSRSIMSYAKKINLGVVTTHTLRHACATHLLEKGADITIIQELLGHESIVTTQIYTTVSKKSLEDQFHKFHPRANNECN